MSLIGQINLLATSIGTKIKDLTTSIAGLSSNVDLISPPTGGSTGQVLTKNSAADYDMIWSAPSGGTGLPSYVQETQPVGPSIWYKTNASGTVIDILIVEST